jgi:hypothetical protein
MQLSAHVIFYLDEIMSKRRTHIVNQPVAGQPSEKDKFEDILASNTSGILDNQHRALSWQKE